MPNIPASVVTAVDDVRKALDVFDTTVDAIPEALLPANLKAAKVFLDIARKLVDAADDALDRA